MPLLSYYVYPVSIELCLYSLSQAKKALTYTIIYSLQLNKSTGPDNISLSILKPVGPVVVSSLAKIINSLPSSNCYPEKWRQACVKHCHKGGDRLILTIIMSLDLCYTYMQQTD